MNNCSTCHTALLILTHKALLYFKAKYRFLINITYAKTDYEHAEVLSLNQLQATSHQSCPPYPLPGPVPVADQMKEPC